jgi:hypothetical protein
MTPLWTEPSVETFYDGGRERERDEICIAYFYDLPLCASMFALPVVWSLA